MTRLDPAIALILLAAGRSERFGGEKLVTPFKGKPLWEWAAEAAENSGFQNLYLVTGEHTSIASSDRWRKVINPDAAKGMGTSIAAGVAAADAHERVVIALADMPLVTSDHLRALAHGTGAVFTRQQDGKAGCPAGFGRESFAALRKLTGDQGARGAIPANASILQPDDPVMLFDVDMQEDLHTRF